MVFQQLCIILKLTYVIMLMTLNYIHSCGENLQHVQDNLQSECKAGYKQIVYYYVHDCFKVSDNVDWILAEAMESQCVIVYQWQDSCLCNQYLLSWSNYRSVFDLEITTGKIYCYRGLCQDGVRCLK